jgi:ABC-type amino acid transport substrate-binding protein
LDTVSEAPPDHRYPFAGQLFWVLPVALATAGLTVLLWKNGDWGANAAAVIGVPISICAVVVTILIDRGTFKTAIFRKPVQGGARMRVAVYFTATALVLSGVVWWWKREPNPFDFMSGEVRVGYFDDNYPGWHESKGGVDVGFDVDLKNAIEAHFAKSHLVWVPIYTLDNRAAALRGSWRDLASDGTPGPTQRRVKLVISNFSMTPARAELIDFAGPYFVDTQAFLTRTDIITLSQIDPGSVCVLRGSTSADKLARFGWKPTELPSTSLCLEQFAHGLVDAVSDDRSILEGYAVQNHLPRPIELGFGAEKYGIGIPDNMPRLCGELRKVLEDFNRYEWQTAYKENLQNLNVTVDRPPASVDACQQAGPWLDW